MKPNAADSDYDIEYIRDLILSTGMTQAELAKKLGVTPRAIRQWTSGARQCPYTTQFALEALVLSPD